MVMPCLQKVGSDRDFDAIRERLVAACAEISEKLL
jgi:hypothetical protein